MPTSPISENMISDFYEVMYMPPEQAESTSLDALNEAFMELDRAYDQLAKSCGLSEPEPFSASRSR